GGERGGGGGGQAAGCVRRVGGKGAPPNPPRGRAPRHYRQHQQGRATSTNATASIFAWTGALKHRAKLDDNAELLRFTETLEQVVVSTIESGFMTKDLALLVGADQSWLSTSGFLDKIDANLRKAMADRAAAYPF